MAVIGPCDSHFSMKPLVQRVAVKITTGPGLVGSLGQRSNLRGDCFPTGNLDNGGRQKALVVQSSLPTTLLCGMVQIHCVFQGLNVAFSKGVIWVIYPGRILGKVPSESLSLGSVIVLSSFIDTRARFSYIHCHGSLESGQRKSHKLGGRPLLALRQHQEPHCQHP